MGAPTSDVTISDGTVEVTSGLYDTDDGLKLQVAGDANPRIHLTPQGLVKTGSGVNAPTELASSPVLFSQDFRYFDDGAIGASGTTNGEGSMGPIAWTDLNSLYGGAVAQAATVQDGVLQYRHASPYNMVVINDVSAHTAASDRIRIGVLHGGFLDDGTATEADDVRYLNITLTDTAGTGPIIHFHTEYDTDDVYTTVHLGRDVTGTPALDATTATLDRSIRAGDVLEFDVYDNGTTNVLTAYVNGESVLTLNDASDTFSELTNASIVANVAQSGTNDSKWLPSYYAYWGTTGSAWRPEGTGLHYQATTANWTAADPVSYRDALDEIASRLVAVEDPGTIAYTPGNGTHWADTDPANVQDALDRLASIVYTLNSSTAIP